MLCLFVLAVGAAVASATPKNFAESFEKKTTYFDDFNSEVDSTGAARARSSRDEDFGFDYGKNKLVQEALVKTDADKSLNEASFLGGAYSQGGDDATASIRGEVNAIYDQNKGVRKEYEIRTKQYKNEYPLWYKKGYDYYPEFFYDEYKKDYDYYHPDKKNHYYDDKVSYPYFKKDHYYDDNIKRYNYYKQENEKYFYDKPHKRIESYPIDYNYQHLQYDYVPKKYQHLPEYRFYHESDYYPIKHSKDDYAYLP